MPRLSLPLTCTVAALLLANTLVAQSTMTPLSTFGTSGWLAPGTSSYITTGNTERGLAYNPVTGNLVLVSRAGGNNIRILDSNTGADLGGLDATGMAGGTYLLNMVGVADDGSIYVGNLSISATAVFKVYKWDSEALGFTTPPTVAYSATTGLARSGDSFAVTGGAPGVPIQFAVAGSTAVTASCFAIGSLDGLNTTTAYLSIPGTTTTSNDYRLALAFVDSTTLIGNQGTNARYTTIDPVAATATVAATIPLGASQRPMDYAVIGGTPVLAVIDSVSSLVSVYDVSIPSSPLLLASANNTVTPAANANATGSVQWGQISGNTATLYAMGSNQGIQAFSVTIQQPARATTFGVGCGSPAVSLDAIGAPVLPSTIQLVTDNMPATAIAGLYAYGFVAIPGGVTIPVPAFCSQYIAPSATVFFLTGASPSYQLSQNFPSNPSLAGVEIFMQSIVLDQSAGLLTSNGLRLYLQTF